ncbi:MAG: Isoquinoline 1-oxidoreductase subunit [Steroidobacteraceae bacterium]
MGAVHAADAPTLPDVAKGELRSVEAFSSIHNKRERSLALFGEVGRVLTHPRCVNCHPAGERPLQTDAMRPHEPLVVRGPDGHGHATGLRCDTCHQAVNNDIATVPGNPKWGLAPASMAWEGRSLGQICEQIKDRTRNGNMNMKALIEHMSHDILVGWGWSPGVGREPAPGTQQQFGALFKAWADSGAYCPAVPPAKG